MKKLELSIFKRLALSIIGIIIIPIILFISHEVLSRSHNELEEKRKESIRNLELIYSKLVDTYAKLETIQLTVSKDIGFLDFLTDPLPHNPVEYTIFQRENLKNYEKILLNSRAITEFKIYVDNENLLELYPYVKNKLPLNKLLKDESNITIKNGKPFLYYFKEIYFYPKKVYLEMQVDLSTLFNETISSYYFVDKGEIINPPNKTVEKIEGNLSKVNFDTLEKTKVIKEKDELYIFQKLPFTEVKLLNVVYQKSIIDIKYLVYLMFLGFCILIVIYFISYFISKKSLNSWISFLKR